MKFGTRGYRAHGLCIRSEIELPFADSRVEEEADLKIRVGALPESLPRSRHTSSGWQVAPGRLQLNVERVARYLVRGQGTEVEVSSFRDGDGDVRAFLLGSVLGACLQLRGRLTLHASAIETGAGAVLFAGPKGSGKSTLLAALLGRGYRMMADDVSGIVLNADGHPEMSGAFPHVRLWADAMDRLGWNAEQRALEEVRGKRRKWRVPVERFREAPLAVRAVAVLAAGDEDSITVEPLPGSAAFAELIQQTYRPRLVRELGLERRHFGMIAATVRHVQVVRVRRPRDAFRLDELADRIVEHLRLGEAPSEPSG